MVTGIETPHSLDGNQSGGLSWPFFAPLSAGGSSWKELGYTEGKVQTFPPLAIPHGHLRKHAGFSSWLRRRDQGKEQTFLCSLGLGRIQSYSP